MLYLARFPEDDGFDFTTGVLFRFSLFTIFMVSLTTLL